MTEEVTIDTAYGEEFFAEHHGGARSSAERIVPRVIDLLHPQSAIDVGCGTGTWLAVFQQHGVSDIFGIDGDYVRQETLDHVDQFAVIHIAGRRHDKIVR